MDRRLSHEVAYIHMLIKQEEEKSYKLHCLKTQIKEILDDYIEIPEEEVFEIFHKIDNLSKYVKKRIDKAYKQIEDL